MAKQSGVAEVQVEFSAQEKADREELLRAAVDRAVALRAEENAAGVASRRERLTVETLMKQLGLSAFETDTATATLKPGKSAYIDPVAFMATKPTQKLMRACLTVVLGRAVVELSPKEYGDLLAYVERAPALVLKRKKEEGEE